MASIFIIFFSLIGIVWQIPDLGSGEDYGILILLIVVIFREVREIFRSFFQAAKYNKMASQVKDLHVWHNVHDSDGTKLWYVKGSLEKSIRQLTTAILELPEKIK
ncbi:hypothetical protein LCGC14_0500880 [marine sediment metagenome]|uniref:Uncharacterized protein n=1 Tax=marine sediment metagenome TaxID=412755 RepID=A0A0F9VCG9_9ZZZZ